MAEYYAEDLGKVWSKIQAEKRHKACGTKLTPESVARNRFYVGSYVVLRKTWGHETLEAATEHAKELMQEDGDDKFIVQIVRLVRQPKVNAEIEDLDEPILAEVERAFATRTLRIDPKRKRKATKKRSKR